MSPPSAAFLRRFTGPAGRRLALATTVLVVVVAAPLGELWRRHGSDLHAAKDARQGLHAAALAMQTRQALSAHRPYAAAVLAGREEQAGERLHRQRTVDAQVAALGDALERQRLFRALDEADQLRESWSELLVDIARVGLDAAASDARHDLLIEQTWVVADLVVSASGLQPPLARGADREALWLATRLLPRLSQTLERWPAATQPPATRAASQRLHADARHVLAVASDLLAQLEGGEAASEHPPRPLLLEALAVLRRDTQSLLAAMPTIAAAASAAQAVPPAAAAALPSAAAALSTATAAGTNAAVHGAVHAAALAAAAAQTALLEHLDAELLDAVATLRAERACAATALLLALVAGLLAALRALPLEGDEDVVASAFEGADGDRATTPDPADEPAGAPGGAESAWPTHDLLRRLRRREPEPEAPGAQPGHEPPPAR